MMKNRNISLFGIIIAVMLFASSCSSSKQVSKKEKQIEQLSNKDRLKLERMFLDANKAKILGEYQKARTLFSECIKLDPGNHASMYELAYIYLQTRESQPAKLLAKQAVALDPENKWYQLLYAEALGENGSYKEAAAVYEGLIEKNPDKHEYYFDWAFMLVKAKDYTNAIKVYNKLESIIGIDESIIFKKQVIYLTEGKVDKAIQETERLIEAYPSVVKYRYMLAELHMATDDLEKAYEVYQKILVIDPSEPKVHLLIADYHLRKKDDKNYFLSLQKAFETKDLDIDKKITILISYFNYFTPQNPDTQKIKDAYILSDILIEAHPKDAKAYAIYGDLLVQENKFEKARDMFLLSLHYNDGSYKIWEKTMLIDAELTQYDSLLYHSQQAIELFPNQAITYFYNGISNSLLENYEESIAPFETALLIGVDETVQANIFSNLGDAYYNLNNYIKSDSCYEKALELEPEKSYVLNNYSYYLSLRNENLSKALDMAKKANELEPNNISFQDTYGWVLYKLGKFDKAKVQIEKCLDNGGDKKAVILEHYGDILYQLGDTDNAVINWKKAKDKGLDSEFIDKKITDKKLYE